MSVSADFVDQLIYQIFKNPCFQSAWVISWLLIQNVHKTNLHAFFLHLGKYADFYITPIVHQFQRNHCV